MPAARSSRLRRTRRPHRYIDAQRDAQGAAQRNDADLLSRKQILCNELVRIDDIVARLHRPRRIGPDVSADDLRDLFQEQRDRLFERLRELDAAFAQDIASGVDPVQDANATEFRRYALAAPEPVDFR